MDKNEVHVHGTSNEEELIKITGQKDLTPYFKQSDHSINKVYLSEVPKVCREEPCQLGVDEAGRGPVLGPMVYGISYAPLSRKQLLEDLGCEDSKALTEQKRDEIFDQICQEHETMGWAVDVISPNFIANNMYRRSKTSLNDISMTAAIELIKRASDAGVRITEVYVDTVGSPEKYQAKLKEIFPEFKITVAKKADSTYPIVSAASICAKVSRDHAIRAWEFREGIGETEYGSGYPNDPLTKKWLSSNVDPVFGFPQIVRFSWSTAEKIIESDAFIVEWEDAENMDERKEQKISKFFTKASPNLLNHHKAKHAFFIDRCLSSTTML